MFLRFFCLLLPSCCLFFACVGSEPAPKLPSSTQVPDSLAERSLLLLIADRREYEPFTVEKALGGSAELRRELAIALGRSGHPDGRLVLEGLVLDEAAAVREAALFGLGVGRFEEASPTLLAVAAGTSRGEATLAVEALGKTGTELRPLVVTLTAVPEQERWARLLPSLWRFSGNAVSQLALLGRQNPDAELRAWAALALATQAATADAEVLAALRAALQDPDPRARAWAALAWMKAEGPEPLTALAPLLNDREVTPVVVALRAGATLAAAASDGQRRLWQPRVASLLRDARSAVRQTALETVASWMPQPELSAQVMARFTSGSARDQELALTALSFGSRSEALPALSVASASPVWRLRRAAAQAASRLGIETPLVGLSRDVHPAVREAALVARLDRSTENSDHIDLLAFGLGDDDPGVRSGALRWLGDHPVLAYEALWASAKLAGRDFLPGSSRFAVSALVARGLAEPSERGAVVRALEALAAERDFLLRQAAVDGLARLGRPIPPLGGVESGRGADVYRDILARMERPHRVTLRLPTGSVELELLGRDAPLACTSFLQLTSQGYFDGLDFHRVELGQWVATGDPRGDGWGGPGYTLRDEISRQRPRRGSVVMISAQPGGLGPNTAGSQFQILLADQPRWDGLVTVFGRVTSGLELLDGVEEGSRVEVVRETSGGLR